MEVYQNYKKYREYVPEYKQWKEERNNQEAKRLEYIKRNPDAINKDDLQRSKALLHAIDVMDEYSQKMRKTWKLQQKWQPVRQLR